MSKPLTLSSAILLLCISLTCRAQELVPTLRLTGDETTKAKQLAQTIKDAEERSAQANVAWEQFHKSYQAAHRDLPGLRFTDDFRLATAQVNSPTAGVSLAATIELTAEERKKLETLHREMTESKQLQKQARTAWEDFKYQLVFDHFGSFTAESYYGVTLSSGKQVRIPSPWNRALVFTTDFKLAFPLAP